MDPESTTLVRGGQKRTSSRHSITTDTNHETTSGRSQRSSGTAARYRWVILDSARIFVRSGPPPKEIRPRINAVIQREISEERKREISLVAEKLCDGFTDVLDGANREDDCVEPIHNALSSMDNSKSFSFPRKAGIVFPFWICVCIMMLTFLRLGSEPQAKH